VLTHAAALQQATKQLVNLLTSPLDTYDVVSVLSLSSYPKVMDVLEHNTRKQMAVTIVRCVLKSGTIVQEVEQVWRRAFPAGACFPMRLIVQSLSAECGVPGGYAFRVHFLADQGRRRVS
jgi:hypothetical protein